MPYVCSFCHARFEADPAADKKCPNCKAEAGIEAAPGDPPKQMRYFGVFLLVTTILTIGAVLVGVTS
jgi:hypothetical protein